MTREWQLAWLGWAGVALGLAVVTLWAYDSRQVEQPVAFNHKRHADWGIACAACHLGAGDSVKATIPNTPVCALCHMPGRAEPKTPQTLAEYIEEGLDIPWKKLYQAPSHVRFSHKRHVAVGGVECASCHGDVASMERPLGRQPVKLAMGRCLDCHRRERVTTDCLACHR